MAFDTARLAARRGRQPVVVVAFAAVLAAMVAIGVGGRTPSAQTAGPAVAGAASVAAPTPTAGSAGPSQAAPTPALAQPSFGSPRPVVAAGIGGPMELKIRRPAASIFVHGDVFPLKVTWVFISLQDALGDVKGFASVSIPGAAVPGTPDGPSLRFDLDIALPPDMIDRDVWVQAIAYDAMGKIVGTVRIGIRADGGPVDGPRGFGGPSGGDVPSTGNPQR